MAVRSRVAVGVDIRIEWGGGERRAFGRLAMSLSCLRSLLITSTDNQIGKLESNKFSLLSQTLTLLSLKGVHLPLSSGKNLICESLSELSFSGWQTVLLHLIRFELCLSWKYFYTHLCFPMGKYLRKWSFCPCTHWLRNEGSLMVYPTSWAKKVRIFPIFSWKCPRWNLFRPGSTFSSPRPSLQQLLQAALAWPPSQQGRSALSCLWSGNIKIQTKLSVPEVMQRLCSKLCQREKNLGKTFSRAKMGESSAAAYLAAHTWQPGQHFNCLKTQHWICRCFNILPRAPNIANITQYNITKYFPTKIFGRFVKYFGSIIYSFEKYRVWLL